MQCTAISSLSSIASFDDPRTACGAEGRNDVLLKTRFSPSERGFVSASPKKTKSLDGLLFLLDRQKSSHAPLPARYTLSRESSFHPPLSPLGLSFSLSLHKVCCSIIALTNSPSSLLEPSAAAMAKGSTGQASTLVNRGGRAPAAGAAAAPSPPASARPARRPGVCVVLVCVCLQWASPCFRVEASQLTLHIYHLPAPKRAPASALGHRLARGRDGRHDELLHRRLARPQDLAGER